MDLWFGGVSGWWAVGCWGSLVPPYWLGGSLALPRNATEGVPYRVLPGGDGEAFDGIGGEAIEESADDAEAGLGDALAGAPVAELLVTVADNVRLLPAGHPVPNPGEVLASDRLDP